MISELAVVAKTANIANDVYIGPYCIVGDGVTIAKGCVLESHVVIKGNTKIGENNKFYPFAVIGLDSPDKKYNGEDTQLHIGDNNVFREGCTVHRGTLHGGGVTIINNNNLFMVNSHVAHDCVVGSHVVFSNNASIAGHVIVDDYANLGGFVGVHQFCKIGQHSFAAGGSIIFKDVAPYSLVSGNPAKSFGLNSVGMQRHNFCAKTQQAIKKAYKIFFKQSATQEEALGLLKDLQQEFIEVANFVAFVNKSTRGLVR